MKNINLIAAIMLGGCLLSSCGGDHGANKGRDTEKNSYHVTADSSTIDTSKVSAADATTMDNTASGGTKIKDTSKMKADSSKKH